MKNPQENENGGKIILDDVNKEKRTIPGYKQCFNDIDIRVCFFINSQKFYELPKRTIRANGNVYLFQTEQFQRDTNPLPSQSKYVYDAY